MTITEKAKAEKILDEAIRKHKNAINDWKAYEHYKKENDLVSAEIYLCKFQDGISYAEGIYYALVTIGFTHPKMKEFSDMGGNVMYRQYEKPNTLKEALAHLKREYQIALENNADEETLISLHDDIADLKERLNFAYQDMEE